MLFWQLSYLYSELIFKPRHNLVLHMINFVIRQRPWRNILVNSWAKNTSDLPVHGTIVDSITETCPVGFWMKELVNLKEVRY